MGFIENFKNRKKEEHGFTTVLNHTKLDVLKKVEEQAIQREKELIEINKIEESIDKHNEIKNERTKKRTEKSLARLGKLKSFLKKFSNDSVNTEQLISKGIMPTQKDTKVDEEKFKEFTATVLGTRSSIEGKENNGGTPEVSDFEKAFKGK